VWNLASSRAATTRWMAASQKMVQVLCTCSEAVTEPDRNVLFGLAGAIRR
jgi:hypothetical protein